MLHKKILIVEDEVVIAMELEHRLEKLGYKVIGSVIDTESAIAAALESNPDLILMDINLNDSDDGIVTAAKINEFINIPIIFLSAYSDDLTIERAKEIKPFGYLTKPFKEEELKTTIEMAFEKHNESIQLLSGFHWAIDNATEGYLILDKDSRIIYANVKAKNLLNLNHSSNEKQDFLTVVKRNFTLKPESIWNKWPLIDKNDSSLFLILPETLKSTALWIEVDLMPSESSRDLKIIQLKEITDSVSSAILNKAILSSITHKLRTPVHQIIGYIELLMNYSDTPDKISSRIKRVAEGAERLRGLVEDVLKLNPYQNNNKKDSELKILFPLCKKLSSELQIKQLTYNESEINTNEILRISENSLEIILFEIFENAKKFHPSFDPNININISKNKNFIIIKVENSGTSIDPQHLNKLGIPFFQIEKNITGEISGSGLGLATVGSLVWMVGGDYKIINNSMQNGVIVELMIPFYELR